MKYQMAAAMRERAASAAAAMILRRRRSLPLGREWGVSTRGAARRAWTQHSEPREGMRAAVN